MQPCIKNEHQSTEVDKQNLESVTNIPKCTDDKPVSIWRVDLYVIAKIWIDILTKMLVGSGEDKNPYMIPVVEARDSKSEEPKRPPKMKYKDLSMYDAPHYEYKDYLEDKHKCPAAKEKLLHKKLLPYVKAYKSSFNKNLSDAKEAINSQYNKIEVEIGNAKESFLKTMRDPENEITRNGFVVAGGVAGYFLGGSGGIPRRLLFTSCGLLSAGAITFPKETDEAFRGFAHHVGQTAIALYNTWCRQQFKFHGSMSCEQELPPNPPDRKALNCPPPSSKKA